MLDLTLDQLSLALVIVAGVALVCLLSLLGLWLRVRKLRRDYVVLRGDGSERDIVEVVTRFVKRLEALDSRLDGMHADLEAQSAIQRFALQKFHLVRFDAFDDMGGRLSFSAALLDEHGDGLIVTSINGRTETRTYAKPVKALSSDYNLSDEEREAIAGATGGFERSSSRATVKSRS